MPATACSDATICVGLALMTSRNVPSSLTSGVEGKFSPTIVIWP
jgi:hypothetical protein